MCFRRGKGFDAVDIVSLAPDPTVSNVFASSISRIAAVSSEFCTLWRKTTEATILRYFKVLLRVPISLLLYLC